MPADPSSLQASPMSAGLATAPIDGIAALAHFGLLKFTGADVQTFLQGQVSCDVGGLQRWQAIYGSYNTPKGRMLATFLLWRDDTGYAMQLPRSLCEPIRRRLSMYVLRSKVSIHDAGDGYELLGAVGSAAKTHIARLFPDAPAQTLTMTSGLGASLLRLDDERFLIVVQRGHALREELTAGLAAVSPEIWDWTNIRAGIPYITPATQDQFVPQMANLDLINGVSFSKGCYPGQEIVARMHYLGKLKQRMYLASTEGEVPQPGDKLYSPGTGEQSTGMVVNSAAGPDGRHAMLAVMHIDSFNAGEVHLRSPAGARLVFTDLPYAVPA
ncbi:MAG: folate-binding protein YgfZ [Betaproteobacteria bacterium]